MADIWDRVDEYLTERLIGADPALDAALADSAAAGLPAIQVSAPQGKLLQLLARIIGARRILEIGTLGGYSTIWLARGLALGGHIDTLDVGPRHAEVARVNLLRAGVADSVTVHLGPAIDTLPALTGPADGSPDVRDVRVPIARTRARLEGAPPVRGVERRLLAAGAPARHPGAAEAAYGTGPGTARPRPGGGAGPEQPAKAAVPARAA